MADQTYMFNFDSSSNTAKMTGFLRSHEPVGAEMRTGVKSTSFGDWKVGG